MRLYRITRLGWIAPSTTAAGTSTLEPIISTDPRYALSVHSNEFCSVYAANTSEVRPKCDVACPSVAGGFAQQVKPISRWQNQMECAMCALKAVKPTQRQSLRTRIKSVSRKPLQSTIQEEVHPLLKAVGNDAHTRTERCYQ